MKKFWINNGQVERQLFEGQEIPQDFVKGRLPKIKKIDILSIKISKEELYKYYILDNHSFEDTLNYFNLQIRADLRQLLTLYNIHKDPKKAAEYTRHGFNSIRDKENYRLSGKKSSVTQKKSWENKSIEEKAAWSNLQSKAHSTEQFKQKIKIINQKYQANLSNEEKELQNKKRSNTLKNTWKNNKQAILNKMSETRKNNKPDRLCRSLIEQTVYDELIKHYPDLIYDQIIDENLYPYFVDFYIPSIDLYIELNGHPSHGKVPFDCNDSQSLQECYKLYGDWLDVYTRRDVEKLKTAQNNNLNYLRIYPHTTLEKNLIINNFKFTDIMKIIFNIIQ